MSIDRLQEKIFAMGNPSVFGLDPLPEYIPPHIMARHMAEKGETLAAAAAAYEEFGRGLIDALCDIVPAVKPQSAFFEMLGPEGVFSMQRTMAYAKEKGLYIIGDVKRGDIGSTAAAYSAAYLGRVQIGSALLTGFDFDSVTINAYLGSDGVRPFIETCKKYDKAIFALVKTSNPSSKELQDLSVGSEKLYDIVGRLLMALGEEAIGPSGYSCVGAVVGATYPEELRLLREKLPRTFFLVPGYGAQGGAAGDVAAAFDDRGGGAIVNSSRGIICAWQKTGHEGRDYMEAARAAALAMREDLISVLPRK
jgi:orotidine-5'-phosphate decarboxylase